MLGCNNVVNSYSFVAGTNPAADAAFGNAGGGLVTGPLSIAGQPAAAQDGGLWVVVN